MRTRTLLLAVIHLALAAPTAAWARSDEAVRRNNFRAELLRQGKLAEAIAEFRQAVTADPGYAAGWRNLGFALDKQGQVDEAVAAYHKAIQLEPGLNAQNKLGVLTTNRAAPRRPSRSSRRP